MKCTVWGIQSIIMEWRMVTHGMQTYHGGHFVMYRNVKSLCCVPGTNIVLQVDYISKPNKLTGKEIRFVVTRDGSGGWNWMKAVKRYKLPVIR